METHAHHLHKAPGKNLWHYLFEFLMLFIAVFCGFVAENWREHITERKHADAYAQQLIQEIGPDTTKINIALRYMNGKEKSVDSLLYYLKLNVPLRWKNIYFTVADLDVYKLPDFHKAAFDQIKNSGSLRYFSTEITNAIQEYTNSMDLVESYQNYIRRFFDDRLSPFLAKNFDREINYYTKKSDFNRLSFDRLWEKGAQPSQFLSGEKNAEIEFKNLLYEIKEAAKIRNAYTQYKESGKNLAGIIKKEYHLE